jgi:hypothetical protein
MGTQKILNLKNLQYDYDNISDVLYVSFGKPKKAIAVESEEGYLIRYEPFTDRLIGVTIIDFKEKFFKNKRLNVRHFIQNNLPQIISKID